jgi:hypothetical protein
MKGLVNIPDKQLGGPLEQKATPANVDVLGLKAKIVVIKTLHLLGYSIETCGAHEKYLDK